MAKTGFLRALSLGLTMFFTAAYFASSGVFAADGLPGVESSDSDTGAIAITIDSEHLIELYQSLPELKIIDSPHCEDYIQGNIAKPTDLPLMKTNGSALSELANDKEQAMVFYCNGNAAEASNDAIRIASTCSYKRLFWFRGGFVDWQDKDYPYVIE